MKTRTTSLLNAAAATALLAAGCAPRMTVATGTTIGLHATPGDLSTQPPQITVAYKRAEAAWIPTGQTAAKKDGSDATKNTDAYSSIAIIDFKSKWFGTTSIDQFVASGHASRDIQDGGNFTQALLAGAYQEPPPEILARRNALIKKIAPLLNGKTAEEQNTLATALLQNAGYGDISKPAINVLQDALVSVRTEETMKNLESAYTRLP